MPAICAVRTKKSASLKQPAAPLPKRHAAAAKEAAANRPMYSMGSSYCRARRSLAAGGITMATTPGTENYQMTVTAVFSDLMLRMYRIGATRTSKHPAAGYHKLEETDFMCAALSVATNNPLVPSRIAFDSNGEKKRRRTQTRRMAAGKE